MNFSSIHIFQRVTSPPTYYSNPLLIDGTAIVTEDFGKTESKEHGKGTCGYIGDLNFHRAQLSIQVLPRDNATAMSYLFTAGTIISYERLYAELVEGIFCYPFFNVLRHLDGCLVFRVKYAGSVKPLAHCDLPFGRDFAAYTKVFDLYRPEEDSMDEEDETVETKRYSF